MRSFITIVVLVAYVVLFNIYLIQLLDPAYSLKCNKLFYNYLTLSMLLFCLIDLKTGFENKWHKEFNWICWWCLIINYILIILTHHKVLADPVKLFMFFNGSVFTATVIIYISGIRHGVFKN